ncbi:hypothetical protein [Haloplanus rubicundus]|uniref:Uncharacterized protein n=1 Tax=Haloplanus rubicundus TaxID=1547898 RepID=A0A345EBT3_9EURY|nr:hypothetical protein [Haloplanus rubicundus]AXG09655.1 hypothetical protein DU484_07135 [Haloplanus rubicundus]
MCVDHGIEDTFGEAIPDVSTTMSANCSSSLGFEAVDPFVGVLEAAAEFAIVTCVGRHLDADHLPRVFDDEHLRRELMHLQFGSGYPTNWEIIYTVG